MVTITWPDVVAAAPELASTSALTQTDVVNAANTNYLDETMFDNGGPLTRLARIMLAAHLAALIKLGSGGPLIQEGDGRFTRGYAPPGEYSYYATTAYGRAFYNLFGPQAHAAVVL